MVPNAFVKPSMLLSDGVREVEPKKQVGYVVSDLHMFSRRSEFLAHKDAIMAVAAQADVFILNGDTFDFRWTTLLSIEETVVEAVRWLRSLTEKFPNCYFHFILGNHDNVQLFIDQLSKLALERDNLSWHPYYLKLGDSVFLHGDVSDKRMDAAALEKAREEWLHDTVRHPFFHRLYDVAVRLGVHRAASRARYPKKRVAKRVLAYLEDVGLGAVDGVKHVYFGHTHGAISDFEYAGVCFHNAGSPMKGMEFNILRVEIDAEPHEASRDSAAAGQ